MNKILSIFFFGLMTATISSQMIVNGDSLVGNEWIEFDQSYYKIKLQEDGIYRISYEELIAAGIDLEGIEGRDLQLYRNGDQVLMFASNIRDLGPGDFIEFYGERNKGEIDEFLYDKEEDMLNPDYSLVTDTSAYFLTWKDRSTNSRFIEIANNLSGNLPAPLPFYMHHEYQSFSDRHYKPTEQGTDYIRYSTLVPVEGFSSPIANKRTASLEANHIYSNEDNASFRVRFGINKVAHQIRVNFNDAMYEEIFVANRYKIYNNEYQVPIADIKSNNDILVQGFNGAGDKVLVSQVEMTYPREFDFGGSGYYRFQLDEGRFRRYLEIENFNGGSAPVLLDLSNKTRRIAGVEDGKIKINVEARNSVYDFVLFNPEEEGVIKQVTSIKPVQFRNLSDMDHDFVIVSSERLFNDPENPGTNWVQEYADYRASATGGSYNPIVVTAEELYDQFGYGLDRHFISVNNFANYVNKMWPSLEYFFVIGKGIEYQDYRTKKQQESVLTAPYYVPAWGNPGSDNLLFGRKGQNYALKPVGRISVTSPSEVELYLNKVKTQEGNYDLPQTIEDKYWTKKLIHLSGGGKPGEQSLIKAYLQQMENVISQEKFGADVTTFTKSSADPLQNATSDEIIHLIDGGISLITFFGHSAVGTFDFSLEDPSKYSNANRLPMIVSLGCYSGNIFVPSKTKGLSEAFVLEPEVGAVAFAASSGTAYISAQGNLGNNFYNALAEDLYGESIGKALRNMFISLSNRFSIGYITLLHQFTLHGDPALKLPGYEGPDYVIDYSTIRTEPAIISTSDIKYDVIFDVVNLGSGSEDSISIALEHILPDGSVADTMVVELQAPMSRKEVKVSFANIGSQVVGENHIKAIVDVNNDIAEVPSAAAEANNTLDDGQGGDRYAYYVVDNAARPVFPRNYGIAIGDEVILQASTSNVFTPKQNYIFQIDTSRLFEAPLDEGVVNAGGGIIEWKPSIVLDNNKVYYWRITPEAENPILGRVWNGSSFIYLPNSSRGWNQSHYFQYTDDEFDGLALPENRVFQFDTNGFFITIVNKLWDADNTPGYQFDFGNFAVSVRPWNFMNEGVAVVVGDAISGGAWKNNGGDYGSINTSNFGGFRVFGFDTKDSASRQNLINFLNNVIPKDSYVFLWTVVKNVDAETGINDWENDKETYGTTLFEILEDEGSQYTNRLKEYGNVPYSLIYKKGEGKVISEEISESIFGVAKADGFIPILDDHGSMYSTTIGPSQSWEKLLWRVNENSVQDSVAVSIYGITKEGSSEILYENLIELEIALDDIDANIYPYLQVEFKGRDDVERTAPELSFWRVLYREHPELAFDVSKDLIFYNDTLNQGEDLLFKATIANVSEFSSDSLLVRYGITDQNNRREEFFKKYERVERDDPVEIDFNINTSDFYGPYQFSVEINPDEDQFEEYSFNNLGVRPFEVIRDNQNPILDVTFDGVHIMDGDIVSSNPEIRITLEDDNQFFLINDPESFEMKLDTGDANALLTIRPSDPALEFIPGTTGNNKAEIIYRPTLKEAYYTLYVQGRDASNNFSGDNEYAINFRVIDKKSISNVFNYPNPFSTATQFVFTLTGEVPEHVKLQIMTLSGKVVKEVTKEELGDLRVGINRTDFWWDGTDEFGDKLGNGVYLYRLITKDVDGSDYEKFDTGQGSFSQDVFFKEGFGKMVIIR